MKKTYIIVGIVVLYLYFIKKNKSTPAMEETTRPKPQPISNDTSTQDEKQQAFVNLKNNFGLEFAKKIEQLFRWETGHFTSDQFKEGFSPGMVATKTTYPFGWASLDEFNKQNSIDGRRYGIGRTFVVKGKNFRYVKFPNFTTAVNFVSWFIRNKRGGVVQKWNSLDTTASNKYLSDLNTIKTHFV